MKKLTRRQFVVVGTAITCAGAARGETQRTREEPRNMSQPNVLVIHVDQHRMECLGAYGNTDIRTPNIDVLAKDGVRYDNSFCPYPVCTPSRYSLLSGRYVHEHRGWTNHCTLPPGVDTFASILREAGYKTKAVGKMHFTPTYLDLGFDELLLAEQNGPGRWDDDYHRMLRDLGLVDGNDLEDQERRYRNTARPEYWETFGALPSNLPDKHHSTTWIGDRAVETLEAWGGSGQLLMAGFIKPHHPFDPPPEWSDAYDPDKLTLLPGWTDSCFPHDLELSKGYFPHENLTIPALRRVMAYYYATIEHIDREVGRMIDTLKRKGLYESTMIVFTSDHGDYMGHHHLLLKGNNMYDPLVKVPLIIKFPGNERKGAVSDALVNNVDVAPTILAQTGRRPSDGMSGRDLAQGDEGPGEAFSESSKGAHAMARTKTRKLILAQRRGQALFYDLEKDPHETVNLYDDPAYQDEVRALTEAIDRWRRFEDLPETYLNEQAPVIDQPNVPLREDDHRQAMAEYCAEKMDGNWANSR